MFKYINFSIFEIDYDKLLESDNDGLTNLSPGNGNNMTIRINRNDIDEINQDIRSYIDKDDMTFIEMISIISLYIKSGKAKFTDKMLSLFTNGPKPGNSVFIFIYTLDKFIFVNDVDTISLAYKLLGFDHNLYKYTSISKYIIEELTEGFKEVIVPNFKYIEIL